MTVLIILGNILVTSIIFGFIIWFLIKREKVLLENIESLKNQNSLLEETINKLTKEVDLLEGKIKSNLEESRKNFEESLNLLKEEFYSKVEEKTQEILTNLDYKINNINEKITILGKSLKGLIEFLEEVHINEIKKTVEETLSPFVQIVEQLQEKVVNLTLTLQEVGEENISTLKKESSRLNLMIEDLNKNLESLTSLVSYMSEKLNEIQLNEELFQTFRNEVNTKLLELAKNMEVLKEIIKINNPSIAEELDKKIKEIKMEIAPKTQKVLFKLRLPVVRMKL